MTRFKCGKISPCLDKALKIERVRSIGVSGFVRFRVFQCFTRPKWHSSRRCGKSCRDEALGTWAGPCWTMLGPRTLIWLKNIEKPQLYVEEQPDVDLETWIMFWMSHHAVIFLIWHVISENDPARPCIRDHQLLHYQYSYPIVSTPKKYIPHFLARQADNRFQVT